MTLKPLHVSTSITEFINQHPTNHFSMINMMTQLAALMPTSELLTTDLCAPSIRTFLHELCRSAE